MNVTTANVMIVVCRCTSCESVLSGIETQVARANEYKERDERIQQQVDEEVSSNTAQRQTTH